MASNRWGREAEILLLSFVNTNIENFRDDTRRQKALEDTATYLTDKLKFDYNVEHITGKLFRLWNSYGPEDSTNMDILYTQGITMHTLPVLNAARGRSGMLEEVGARVKALRPRGLDSQDAHTKKSDRSLRRNWEIRYCCPFDHDDNMGLVGCDGANCTTWQHRLCCYPDLDLTLIRTIAHYCEACKADQAKTLLKHSTVNDHAFSLPVRSKNTNATRKINSEKGKCERGTMSDPNDAEQEAPEDQITALRRVIEHLQQENLEITVSDDIKNQRLRDAEAALIDHHRLGQFTTFGRTSIKEDPIEPIEPFMISNFMMPLRSQSQRIAQLILCMRHSRSIFFDEDKSANLRNICPELDDCQIDAAHKETDTDSNKENFLATVVILLIKRFVFEPTYQTQSLSDLLLGEFEHCVFQRDGAEALQSLHRATWSRLSQSSRGKLGEYHNLQANTIATNILDTLKKDVESSNETSFAEDKQAELAALRSVFVSVVRECLRFKARVALSDAFYEMQIIPPGTKFDSSTMTLDSFRITGGIPKNEQVLFCLLPAIVRYPTKTFKELTTSFHDVGVSGRFINRSKAQRSDGTVLFQALVTLK